MVVIYLVSIIVGLWLLGLMFGRTHEKKQHFWLTQILYLVSSAAIVNVIYFGSFIDAKIGFIVGWSLVYLLIWLSFILSYYLDATIAFSFSVWTILLWQITVEMVLIISSLLGITFDNIAESPAKWPGLLLIGIAIIGMYLIYFFIMTQSVNRDMPRKLGPRQLAWNIGIFVTFEVIAINMNWPFDITVNSNWPTVYIAQLALIIILYLESELFKNSAMRKELETMNTLRLAEQEQYKLSKANIELINQKCHDLKHQVRALRQAKPEDIEKYLTEVEDSIEIYEAIVKTGNDVLDTILTEKSLYCRKHGIIISVVADGEQMDFIDTIDLYAILGNAIDNAIEAVRKFKDRDLRTIDVMVYRKDNFLVINIVNPMTGELEYTGDEEDALPVTTKSDKDNHGFGLRSIRYIVKRYDGFTSISTEDACFSLKILIPLP